MAKSTSGNQKSGYYREVNYMVKSTLGNQKSSYYREVNYMVKSTSGNQKSGYYRVVNYMVKVLSTLVISNSKGLSEILRDIRTSTYQICRIEEK